MDLAERNLSLQLPLPLPSVQLQPRMRSVWLLSASKGDADALRSRSFDAPSSCFHPFLLMDMQDGNNPICPEDIILLKTAERPGIDVLTDPASIGSARPSEFARKVVASFRESTARPTGSSLDLGFVRFASNTRIRHRLGWSRTAIESTIDVLLLKGLAQSDALTERLCGELLDNQELSQVCGDGLHQ